MLPSLRERLVVDLRPARVVLTRFARGWPRRDPEQRVLPVEPSADSHDWQPLTNALRGFLSAGATPADAIVVLSDRFVRYLLVPWNAQIVRRSEEIAVTQELFARQFASDMQDWEVRLSGARRGEHQVAAAIERSLLDVISTIFAASPIRLHAVRPHFMQVINGHRRALEGDAWVVVAEADRMLVGFLRNGSWLSLRSRPLDPRSNAMEPILEQEALLHGIAPQNAKIYVYEADKIGDAAASQLLQPISAPVERGA